MRRLNPWIAVPAVTAGLIGAALGWIVTDVSCRVEVEGVIVHCPGWSSLFAGAGFLSGLVGAGTLMVLVYRSMAEARAATGAGRPEPEAGGESEQGALSEGG